MIEALADSRSAAAFPQNRPQANSDPLIQVLEDAPPAVFEVGAEAAQRLIQGRNDGFRAAMMAFRLRPFVRFVFARTWALNFFRLFPLGRRRPARKW